MNLQNENILNMIVDNSGLRGCIQLSNKINNRSLNNLLLKRLTYENIFKSIDKTHHKLVKINA
jgi:hypothetical protein